MPLEPGLLHLTGPEAAARCDENTIGVVAIMGSTFDGSYEPVAEIVVRNGFSRDLADVFLADLRRHSRAPAEHLRAHTPLAPEPFRQGFAH